MLQPIDEIEKFHKNKDPWNYENTTDDQIRKDILLSELPLHEYSQVLDIGCGQGFITRDLPGSKIVGVDISKEAITHAKRHTSERVSFHQASIFEIPNLFPGPFNLIIITGVLYPHYIGRSMSLIFIIVDRLLEEKGILVSVHISAWCRAKFPYLTVTEYDYDYKEYRHKLQIYVK